MGAEASQVPDNSFDQILTVFSRCLDWWLCWWWCSKTWLVQICSTCLMIVGKSMANLFLLSGESSWVSILRI